MSTEDVQRAGVSWAISRWSTCQKMRVRPWADRATSKDIGCARRPAMCSDSASCRRCSRWNSWWRNVRSHSDAKCFRTPVKRNVNCYVLVKLKIIGLIISQFHGNTHHSIALLEFYLRSFGLSVWSQISKNWSWQEMAPLLIKRFSLICNRMLRPISMRQIAKL